MSNLDPKQSADIAVLKNDIGYIKDSLDKMEKTQERAHKTLHKSMEGMLEQQKIANGRTSRLEWWRNAIIWGAGAIFTFILVSGPVFYAMAKKNIENAAEKKIYEIVEKILLAND